MHDIQLAYIIITVPDVEASMGFYESAFGFARRFIAEGGDYGELNTGPVTLSFVSEKQTATYLIDGFKQHRPEQLPGPYEIAFTMKDVQGAVDAALESGASLVSAPAMKPWGQTVAYVRDPNGVLIELCTPVEE